MTEIDAEYCFYKYYHIYHINRHIP